MKMNKMKKILFIILLSLSFTISAQDRSGKEKIHAYKIAYITEKLDLTSDEAEKFWPIYNAYKKQKRELHQAEKTEIKTKIIENGGISNFSDKESKQILEKIHKLRADKKQNRINFIYNISQVLSAKKVLAYEVAEYEFHKKLMKKYKEQKAKEKLK